MLEDKDRLFRIRFIGVGQFAVEEVDHIEVVAVLHRSFFRRNGDESESVALVAAVRLNAKDRLPILLISAVKFMIAHAQERIGSRLNGGVHLLLKERELRLDSVIRHIADDEQRVEILIRLVRGIAVSKVDRAPEPLDLLRFRISVEVNVAHNAAAQNDVVSDGFRFFCIRGEKFAGNEKGRRRRGGAKFNEIAARSHNQSSFVCILSCCHIEETSTVCVMRRGKNRRRRTGSRSGVCEVRSQDIRLRRGLPRFVLRRRP